MTAKFKVDIDTRLCKSCRICVEFCPRQVLALDPGGKARVTQADKCIGCRLCEVYCPDFALTVKEATSND